MKYTFAPPDTLVIFTGLPNDTKVLFHVNMFFLSPFGYIDMYPIDVGAFTQMRVSAVVIPFMQGYLRGFCT